MKEDQWIAKQPQPKMSAHPCLRPANAPNRKSFAQVEQHGKDHHRVSGDSETDAEASSATGPMRGLNGIRYINCRCRKQQSTRDYCPAAVCVIYPQLSPWPL